jgi:hypothetical protein
MIVLQEFSTKFMRHNISVKKFDAWAKFGLD